MRSSIEILVPSISENLINDDATDFETCNSSGAVARMILGRGEIFFEIGDEERLT